jgi:hypothetical protein
MTAPNTVHPPVGITEGLQHIERLIRLEIARLRAAGVPAGQDEYRGLYLSDQEVDSLLTGIAAGRAGTPPAGAVAELQTAMARARAGLATFTAQVAGPLQTLIQFGSLSPFEVGCLLLCLAPEADLRFERLFAYVQDDITKRRPRVELALRLLAQPAELGAARQSFGIEAPLRRHQLIILREEPGQYQTPLPAQYLALDPRIAGFLLEQSMLEPGLRPHIDLRPAQSAARMPPLPADLAQRLDGLAALPATALQTPVLHLTGHGPAELQAVAQALAHGSRLALLSVDLPALTATHSLEHCLTLAVREAALHQAALHLSQLHLLKAELTDRLRAAVAARLGPPLVLLSSDGSFNWPGLALPVPDPDYAGRRALWERGLRGQLDAADTLAAKFRLNGTQIQAALEMARGFAVWRNPTSPSLTLEDLYAAARAQSTPILSSLARKITPRYDWGDIVLPEDTLLHLREMCAYVEHHHVVYKRWGFDRKLALGKGLMALFAGESGTGKTMAADILAGALGLDLYKIDLSGVVSKYIGETEKNLSRIFNEAESSNAILFFDEADALFGKRSEVRDAHDRYANIETAYLLQKMEEYEGAVILATNLKMNLDEAFMRRMHFVVEFAMPEEDDRRRIWQNAFPPEVPLSPEVDVSFLARRFKISGGNIRNIVLSAAFLAAADGQVVTMPHLLQATRREFQKIGRMVSAVDFVSFFDPNGS